MSTECSTADAFDDYETDPELEEGGVWSDEFRNGLEMQIRSPQSSEYKAAQERVNKRCDRFWKIKQPVPDAVQTKNQIDLACAAVAAWRVRRKVPGQPDVVQLPTFGGQTLECTLDNKKAVFGNPKLWSLRMEVIAQANTIDRFRRQALEDDAGNSAAPSEQGSSSAATASA